MILDKKVDLNIYKERSGQELAAACCVTASKVEGKKEPACCCAPSSTCCSTEHATDASKAVAGLDFNEWVSKYQWCPNPLNWSLIAAIKQVRMLYMLSSQKEELGLEFLCTIRTHWIPRSLNSGSELLDLVP